MNSYEERILGDLKSGRHVALTGRLHELVALLEEIDVPAREVLVIGTFKRDPVAVPADA